MPSRLVMPLMPHILIKRRHTAAESKLRILLREHEVGRLPREDPAKGNYLMLRRRLFKLLLANSHDEEEEKLAIIRLMKQTS